MNSVKISKCSGSCNNTNDPYAKTCIPDVVKNINHKVFNLISTTNETRYIKFNETFKCKCRLDPNVCNNKQRWNDDKCRCECKELIDKGSCIKDLFGILVIVNVNMINDVMLENLWIMKTANVEKKLVDKLVEECTEDIDEVKIVKMTLSEHENKFENKCKSSCTIYLVLFSLIFPINIGIGTFFVYYKYMNHDKKQLPKKILPCKQQFTEHIKMTVKSINVKNGTY